MTTIFRTTTDASAIYRERASIDLARAYSSSDTGNLAAATKNSTFQPLVDLGNPVELPQFHVPVTLRSADS